MRRPTKAELKLIRENDGLKTTIICLRRQLTDKQGHIQRLEYALRARAEHIDKLTAKLEQLRDQNRRLDAEADLLIAMIQLTPDNTPHPDH